MTTTNALTAGSKIKFSKGSKAMGIDIHSRATVVGVRELGPDYSHMVEVTVTITSGFKAGKTYALTARHINRLSDTEVSLRDGLRMHSLRVVRAS